MDPDERETLRVVYAAERADGTGLLEVGTALLGFQLAYAAVLGAFMDDDHVDSVGPWVTAAVPLPLILLLCYFTQVSFAAGVRARSGIRLEQALLPGAESSDSSAGMDRHLIGLHASELIFDPGRVPGRVKNPVWWFIQAQRLLVGLVVAGVTLWMLVKSARIEHTAAGPALLAGGAYLVLFILLGWYSAHCNKYLASLSIAKKQGEDSDGVP